MSPRSGTSRILVVGPHCGRPIVTSMANGFDSDKAVSYADAASLDAVIEARHADRVALARGGRRGAERVRQKHLDRRQTAALLDSLGLGRAPGLAWPMLASSPR